MVFISCATSLCDRVYTWRVEKLKRTSAVESRASEYMYMTSDCQCSVVRDTDSRDANVITSSILSCNNCYI